MGLGLHVGACQTPEILGNVEASLDCVEGFAKQAVELLLFPECFLQGYLVTETHLAHFALDLRSVEFSRILRRLEPLVPILVIGMIERSGERIYNSAVVVERGLVRGVYRKRHLTPGESLFCSGETTPVFEKNGVRFGINICSDTRHSIAAAEVADQGADILLVPAQNMMGRERAELWKNRHNEIRQERIRETGMWLVSADVTGERGKTHVGYGPTCFLNPVGAVHSEVPLGEVGLITAQIFPLPVKCSIANGKHGIRMRPCHD